MIVVMMIVTMIMCVQGSDQETPIEHAADGTQLILFSFKGKSLFGKKEKKVRDSCWKLDFFFSFELQVFFTMGRSLCIPYMMYTQWDFISCKCLWWFTGDRDDVTMMKMY